MLFFISRTNILYENTYQYMYKKLPVTYIHNFNLLFDMRIEELNFD